MPRTRQPSDPSTLEALRARIRELEAQQTDTARLLHELETHQEELAAQRDQLAYVQQALEASRDHFEDLFDFCPLPYLILDRNGVLGRVNLAGAKLLQSERRRLIGVPLLTRVVVDDRRIMLDHMRRCRGTSDIVTTEMRMTPRGGDEIPIELMSRVSHHPAEDGEAYFHTIATDLRERRRMENERLAAAQERDRLLNAQRLERAASEAKDRFLAVLSHELRTPLTPILLAASTWTDNPKLPEPLRHAMAMIRRNITVQARLVDDLLDMTRITQGKLVLQREVLDLHDLLQEIFEQASTEMRSADIVPILEVRARSSLVFADPLRVRQVVWNLVKNAVRFTPAGGTIAIRTEDDSDQMVRISVVDSGAGFDRETGGQMFEAFRQGPRNTAHGGLGLGLAIAKGLVEAHGGTILGRSAGAGRGAAFRVQLPTTVAVLPAVETPVDSSPPPQSGVPLRILLVEDHIDTAQALALVLESEGYSVVLAHSVQDAIAASEQAEVDLVVSDLGLPDGSGLDLIRHLKARKPMRGIALTGYGRREDLDETTRAGFERHLTKPVDVSTLIAVIESLRSDAA